MTGVHKSLALLGAAALALSTTGCQQYDRSDNAAAGNAAAGNAAAGADVDAIKDALKADEKAWNDQFKSKDLNGLVSHYASDAYFVAPGLKHASGSAEIRKAYEDALKDSAFTVSFASDQIDVAASGDLAYTRGHFTEKYTEPKTGQIISDGGSFLTVFKKQADGSWKAVEDFTAVEPK
jgi:uncharacterized protein (TIGR02246 family)